MGNIPNVTIEDCRILWRNFAGEKRQYNAAGSRNFCVILDDLTAKKLSELGYNVKWTKGREEYDQEPEPYIKVKVAFGRRPPKIVMITHKGKTLLDEDTVSVLDFAEFKKADLIIRPFEWKLDDGNEGVTAYVKTLFVTIAEDELEIKYSDPSEDGDLDDDEIPF